MTRLFSGARKHGDSPVNVASCTADGIVRDPVFAPVLEAAGNDPTAEPDPALVATVGARLREVPAILQGCVASTPTSPTRHRTVAEAPRRI